LQSVSSRVNVRNPKVGVVLRKLSLELALSGGRKKRVEGCSTRNLKITETKRIPSRTNCELPAHITRSLKKEKKKKKKKRKKKNQHRQKKMSEETLP